VDPLLAVVQDKDVKSSYTTSYNQALLTTDIEHGFLAHEESRLDSLNAQTCSPSVVVLWQQQQSALEASGWSGHNQIGEGPSPGGIGPLYVHIVRE
jgi:hypothetical protein